MYLIITISASHQITHGHIHLFRISVCSFWINGLLPLLEYNLLMQKLLFLASYNNTRPLQIKLRLFEISFGVFCTGLRCSPTLLRSKKNFFFSNTIKRIKLSLVPTKLFWSIRISSLPVPDSLQSLL